MPPFAYWVVVELVRQELCFTVSFLGIEKNDKVSASLEIVMFM